MGTNLTRHVQHGSKLVRVDYDEFPGFSGYISNNYCLKYISKRAKRKRKINNTILKCSAKMIALAKKAKQTVEEEYAPDKKRGLKCIEEYEEEFVSEN